MAQLTSAQSLMLPGLRLVLMDLFSLIQQPYEIGNILNSTLLVKN